MFARASSLFVAAAVAVLFSAAAPAIADTTSPPPGAATTSPSDGTSSSSSAGKTPDRATFGVAPATPGQKDGRTAFDYHLAPGAKYSDNFVVNNFSAEPLSLTISAVDVTNQSDGSLSAGLDQKSATDAGKWIALGHASTVVVAPQSSGGPGQVFVPFTVTVPNNASPGDHAAAVLATLTSTSHQPGANNVQLNQRVGARVLIRIAGPLHPMLEIHGLSASYRGTINPAGSGRVKVHYEITNAGNTILGARQNVTISDKFGTHHPAPAADTPEIPLLLPGKSATMDFTLNGVYPAFLEKLTVNLTPLVQSADSATFHVDPVSASTTFWAIPWPATILFALLIAAAVCLFFLRRYWIRRPRGGRHSHRNPPGTPEKTLDPVG
jgi:hypothetical protein